MINGTKTMDRFAHWFVMQRFERLIKGLPLETQKILKDFPY
jgi:hypothetical protein